MASRPPPSTVLLNLGTGDSEPAAAPKLTKKQDTLFGPNIGIVSAGPEWTDIDQEKSTIDELTPEIVKNWVAKSKEQTSQPTTTLQALVNLKRPTLRLSPLTLPNDAQSNVSHNHAHALEFEYDCDAPKCGISVFVVFSPDHPLAKSSDGNNLTKLSVFETVADGGFGNALKLEEGAVLELGEFERTPDRQTPVQIGTPAEEYASNGEGQHAAEPTTSVADTAKHDRKKQRFSTFHFLKHHDRTHSVAGPALAVVDAEVGAAAAGDEGSEKDDRGVRVIIKLAALDEDGHRLTSANEQITYLHVVKMGSPAAEEEEDKRAWVVQVVKREAKIGPHTFHLHEIYGLSSHGTQSSNQADVASSSPTTPEPHTYPPLPTTTAVDNDEPSSECLLCLSSPREVVLLPCRHLVACRECAVNMVEYGAGGNIVHTDAQEPAQNSGAGHPNENAEPADAQPHGTGTDAPAPTQQRRKRRAKGWFCPVCRQPYTSLLRITTTLPSKAEHDSDEDENEDHIQHEASVTPTVPAANPTPTSRLAALAYPRFLRGLPRGRGEPQTTTPSELERGMNVSAVTAA